MVKGISHTVSQPEAEHILLGSSFTSGSSVRTFLAESLGCEPQNYVLVLCRLCDSIGPNVTFRGQNESACLRVSSRKRRLPPQNISFSERCGEEEAEQQNRTDVRAEGVSLLILREEEIQSSGRRNSTNVPQRFYQLSDSNI